MNAEYCVVLTTFENEGQAAPILETILAEKLAACIQVIPIKSLYVWEGKTQHDNEVLALLKTSKRRYGKLKTRLEELHPYEVPEILSLDVEDGLQAYLEWVDEQTIPILNSQPDWHRR